MTVGGTPQRVSRTCLASGTGCANRTLAMRRVEDYCVEEAPSRERDPVGGAARGRLPRRERGVRQRRQQLADDRREDLALAGA
jgi:hypothetical protein